MALFLGNSASVKRRVWWGLGVLPLLKRVGVNRYKDKRTVKQRKADLPDSTKPLVRNKHIDTHRVTQRSSLFFKVTDSLINGQTQALLVTNRYKFRQRSIKLHKYVYKYAPAGGQPRIRRNLSN